MLKSLSISNFALIDEVHLSFYKGMTAITGETGSGKSILLGAFGLLLGERADTKSIKNEKAKCIVEAVFDLKGYGLKSFFEDNDLDFEETATVRREIAPGGKSRAFINDTPVQLNTLRALGAELVDIHSQHENSLLGQRDFQFSVIDAFAGNQSIAAAYRSAFQSYKLVKKELDEALANETLMRQEMDFLQFQLAELEKAQLADIDQPLLEQELDTLSNAETIKSTLQVTANLLDNESGGVLQSLTQMKSALQKISVYNKSLEEFLNRTDSCAIELRELLREMEGFSDNVSTDEKRVAVVSEKLSLVYQLQKKHRMQTVLELQELELSLREKANGFGSFDDKIEALNKKLLNQTEELSALSKKLTDSRIKAATMASKEVKRYFSELSLDHAELVIDLTESSEFNVFGKDDIAFLFRANKGGQLLPVKQVASGGEISRVMLAIKASISKHKRLPVLILDEIDQGVSGEVGKKIGSILREMSADLQLLTITHLPQIAGKAEHHLKVFKETSKNSTSTFVIALEGEARINELAEMLSGKSISKAAVENAKELMN